VRAYHRADSKAEQKNLVDVPAEAKEKIKFIPVETVDEVLANVLDEAVFPRAADGSRGSLLQGFMARIVRLRSG